jgi:hypothetical protein
VRKSSAWPLTCRSEPGSLRQEPNPCAKCPKRVWVALFAAAEKIREELCGAGAPATAASLLIIVVVVLVTMTIVIVVVGTIVVVVLILVALVASTVALFSIQQLLELATVEKDPTAFLALVDHDAVSLVGAHLAATLRASKNRCVSHFVLLGRRWRLIRSRRHASDADAGPATRHP